MLVALVIVLLIAGWLVAAHVLYRDVLSPLGLLAGCWMLPLALGWLDLSAYEQPWGWPTRFIGWWVTAGLVATSLAPLAITPRARQFDARSPGFGSSLGLLQEPRVRGLLLLTFAGVFALYLYAEFLTNPAGIPALSIVSGERLSGEFHRWGKETRWSIITPVLFVLCPLVYLAARTAPTRALRLGLLAVALLYPLFGLLKLSRSDVYVSALELGLTEFYLRRLVLARPPLTSRRLAGHVLLGAVALVAAVTILYGTLAARLGSRTGAESAYAAAIGFIPQGSGPAHELAAQFYGYLALPFENFRRAFERTEGGFHPGTSSLRPVLSLAGQGRFADQLLASTAVPDPVSSAAGSSTFLTPLYMELGLWGLMIMPLVYGFGVNLLYARFRHAPTLLSYLLYLNFVYPWTWLYFNNAFSVLTFYLNLGFIVVFLWLCHGIALRLRW